MCKPSEGIPKVPVKCEVYGFIRHFYKSPACPNKVKYFLTCSGKAQTLGRLLLPTLLFNTNPFSNISFPNLLTTVWVLKGVYFAIASQPTTIISFDIQSFLTSVPDNATRHFTFVTKILLMIVCYRLPTWFLGILTIVLFTIVLLTFQ